MQCTYCLSYYHYLLTNTTYCADPPPPEELTFQDRYGDLEAHLWLDGGMLLAGFRSGQVAVVATDAARASHGTEVFSSR